MYRLKKGQESFTPVEGPFASRTFVPGNVYAEIPPGTEKRFARVPEAPEPAPDPAAGKPPRPAGKRGAEAPESGEEVKQ